MKVIMPMAGRGSRFNGSGYERPKPLIEVLGRPMFSLAIDSLKNIEFEKIIIISLQEHEENFGVKKLAGKYAPANSELILLPQVTEGQLATVLAAKNFIEGNEDILIVSSDTIVVSNMMEDIKNKKNNCLGLISVADMPGDRWSFAKTDQTGKVIEVTEKIRISDNASTGLYYFSNGRDFVRKAEKMMELEEKTQGEYFVMPLYQKYIDEGAYIGISLAEKMWDLGTPESLQMFLEATRENI